MRPSSANRANRTFPSSSNVRINPPAPVHDPNSLLLYLHGRAALLGEYRISVATETLSSLRRFVVAHLDNFWASGFEVSARHPNLPLSASFGGRVRRVLRAGGLSPTAPRVSRAMCNLAGRRGGSGGPPPPAPPATRFLRR
jgi:hypothetical protein